VRVLYDHDFVKAPGETLDYTRYWDDYLATGETIATSTWTVPTGLTSTLDTKDDTAATIKIAGGTANHAYVVTNTITTSEGRIAVRSWLFTIKER